LQGKKNVSISAVKWRG